MAFIIYCLPRSRSAWMAHFLSYPYSRPLQPVSHDKAVLCGDVGNFIKAYTEEGMWGAVEIGGVIAWQVIRKELPHLKTVVVRRPLQEVYNSIIKLGLQADLTVLAEHNAMLDHIASQPDVYSIKSSDLDAAITCKWLFEYCLEQEFDFDWWYTMSQIDVQVNMEEALALQEEATVLYKSFQTDLMTRMEGIRKSMQ